MQSKVYCILSLLLTLSCSRYSPRLEVALSLAGENRVELERVLEHYRGDRKKYKAYKSYQPKNNLLAMNLEALAEGEDTESEEDSKTYQISEMTRTQQTTDEPGWSWDASLNVWWFNGKISKTSPKKVSTVTITYDCCIKQGLTKCHYIMCHENPLNP